VLDAWENYREGKGSLPSQRENRDYTRFFTIPLHAITIQHIIAVTTGLLSTSDWAMIKRSNGSR